MQLDPARPIVLMVGTRPEAIKMIPVYFAFKKAGLPVLLCSSGQHSTLLDSVFSLFDVKPDFSLQIMKDQQDLFYITSQVLEKTKQLFDAVKPSLILVQGDTTTTMASALAGFYLKIPIGHVEAGLRTKSIFDPYPEELNRRIATLITQYHFAPTAHAVANLMAERIDKSTIYLTGNTVVDALRIVKEHIQNKKIAISKSIETFVADAKQQRQSIVLLTTHRRESFNGGIEQILHAIKQCALMHEKIIFYYPVHPNPLVRAAVKKSNIATIKNIVLSEPIEYGDLVYLLDNAEWIATDSGGICEEAVSLAKRVLILRNDTERPEAILSGYATLTGTDAKNILHAMQQLLCNKQEIYSTKSPFGDGYAAQKITKILHENFNTHVSIGEQPIESSQQYA